jgi:ribonuclease P protein component
MTSPPMSEAGFSRESRLRRQADFDRVHQANVFAADDTLVIRGAANGAPATRIGISISRHVGNAVVRNRWKRLTREAFRLLQPDLPAGLDLVVRPRRGAIAELQAIQRSLRQLVPRLARRLLKEQA